MQRPWRLGLLGAPVSHSVSPAMHAAALRHAGLQGTYEALETPTVQALEAALQALRRGDFDGFNVTIPWKLEAAARCDQLAGEAARLGAANTLVRGPDGGITGHNTDVEGLVRAITEAFPGHALRGRPVAILGAGGAARSALLAAEGLGAGEIRVHNRTEATARALLAALGAGTFAPALQDALDGAALVIQASASGFRLDPVASQALAAELVPALARTAPDAVLYDAVYTPAETGWVLGARRAGRQAASGLGMLVHQAAAAFALWTGVWPDVQVMWAAARWKG